MSKVAFVLVFCALTTAQLAASPPVSVFSPPVSGAPSLHHASSPVTAVPAPAQPTRPTQNPSMGWDALRRETLPEPMGSPASQAWRWLLGLVIALALIKWGLPRALNGGGKGQFAQWLTRVAPPKNEGTITVLDTRLLGTGALHLVTVRGRTLLIGCTAQQVNLLMDLTEQPDNTSAFDRVLAQSRPFTPEPTLNEDANNTQQALDEFQQRLRQARQRLFP
ncbi:MAG: flagellar biosynthetic protein FliO [Armatimonadota bacterium]|nr:flagellar biosynthetic protein FliO [bacterium]MDW8320259.1 flagellar biosynthetic protein FliO [Armatimonadota bacterium]